MNNDFVYKPSKKDSSDSSESAAGGTEDMAPEELNEDTSVSSAANSSRTVADGPASSSVVTSEKPRKGHGPLVFLVMLILLLAAAGGVYYWQHQKVQDLQASKDNLSAQVNSLHSQLGSMGTMPQTSQNAASSPTATQPVGDVVDIVTVSPQSVGMDNALVSVMYSNKASETWVESGTAPDKRTTVAKHVKANGETDMQNFNLTGLEMGTRYYYRAAGMVNGKTVEGGIVSFMTTK